MNQIPFNLYDWLAYLGPGFLASYCVHSAFGLPIPDQGTFSNVVFWIFASYFMGHIVAQFSQIVLEDIILGKIIGKPEFYLLGGSSLWKYIFPRYTKPLPESQIQVILRNTGGSVTRSQEVFHTAFFSVKGETEMKNRLDTFIAQYGAMRNMAFTLLIFSFVTLGTNFLPLDINAVQFFALFTVSFMLFLRFLKFFRIYTREVFGTYGAKCL